MHGLNKMQMEAVLQTEGALLLLAGAGSGKTKTLTHRIAKLIENGVNPFNIIAITFTNKAAREMRQRVSALVGGGAEHILVSTFHSACVRFLRRDIEKLSNNYSRNFTIYDTDDQKSVMKICFSELNIDDRNLKIGKALSLISSQKNKLISPMECEQNSKGDFVMETVSKIYSLYQTKLRKNNALDFDDIIFLTVKLFSDNPHILEAYQERFLYIMVDEYQDTNTAQYKLVKLLAQKHGNICVVGDDDQSIYGWRGANIQNIYDFEKDFPSARVIKLEQNYRSTQNILNAANTIIAENGGRKDKKLWTDKGEGTKVKLFTAENEQDEAYYIVDTIKSLNLIQIKDVAVLYRTNAQSRVLEEQFVKKNVPYRIFGGLRFYERKEIKDILSYLRLIVNPNDDVSAKRIINIPKRGVGKAAVDKIASYGDKNGMPFYEALKRMCAEGAALPAKLKEFVSIIEEAAAESKEPRVASLIEKLLEKTGYTKMLTEVDDEYRQNSRIDNINDLISKAVEFESTEETVNLEEFLSQVALVADIDNYAEDEDAVTLMTIHSAKGLEFPVVFLAGMEDGLFPGFASINYGGLNGIEEERRLFYVGITRAESTLYLTKAKSRMTRGFIEYPSPSRFLKDIPEELVEISLPASKKQHTKIRDEGKREFISSISLKTKTPVGVSIDFKEGDTVIHKKFGRGVVSMITPAGKDYEVTIDFPDIGVKKFMATLSGLKKA